MPLAQSINALGRVWEKGFEVALNKPLQDFLAAHPLVSWLLNHPLWGIGSVLLGLLLGLGLLSAIARLTENFWLTLGQLPLRLVIWLFGAVVGLLRRPRWPQAETAANQPKSLSSSPAKQPDRAVEITLRLEALQQEQAALLQELQTLLGEHPPE